MQSLKKAKAIAREEAPASRRFRIAPAARPAGTTSFVGLLAGRTQKVATIEEINEAATQEWAGKK
jgi:hypothetical protein